MSKKRKDKRGRLLRTGESQRKNGTYAYRYQDSMKKRHSVYAPTLEELRDKEDIINDALRAGINYSESNITVIELVEKYLKTRKNVRYNTWKNYITVLNYLKSDPFGYQKISEVKTSGAKAWLAELQENGKGFSSIKNIRGVVNPAFRMAYEDDILRKNPFDFRFADVVENTSEKRKALSPAAEETFKNFIRNDGHYCRYYDEFLLLLETGMRISELCGLTLESLDFVNGDIIIDHQLLRKADGVYYIEKPKSESGYRKIPMTDSTRQALKNILAKRKSPQTEWTVDGYSGFLLLDQNRKPCVALHIEKRMNRAMAKYRKLCPGQPLPTITPHILRHSFCTDMANAGIEVKSLQCIMGHTDANVTMNVYADSSYEQAKKSMQNALNPPDRKKTEAAVDIFGKVQ